MRCLVIEEDFLFPLSRDNPVWGFLVKMRDGFCCVDCGAKDDLHSHHIDGSKQNNTLENGECVCRSCHGKRHGVGPFDRNDPVYRARLSVGVKAAFTEEKRKKQSERLKTRWQEDPDWQRRAKCVAL